MARRDAEFILTRPITLHKLSETTPLRGKTTLKKSTNLYKEKYFPQNKHYPFENLD